MKLKKNFKVGKFGLLNFGHDNGRWNRTGDSTMFWF